ncbi:Regulatory protein AsnC [Microbacterium sp. 8M]|jgi:Lrp/AsnC family transcriptional regulator for asnA, asnC and gidA|uniref:Lrp/AsnC family transcriptional regulator n=1 Tax=Microbacterium sp. 8M TaxID=2653153 RepID=UPI0012F389E7|nr:Lrp/AsnC family transcriptional regulator [Microbacterium sp. 8M]VXB99343.1 Regulatory protein AsnC [Microbacterium sp. 8M]
MRIDALDAALIRLLTDSPQLPVLECARRLGVARGTVTSRLARLHDNGVIEGIVPRIDPRGFGFALTAFCQVEIDQKVGHDDVADALASAIPEIVDMYTVTGASDMQLRLVAHSAEQLQEVLDRIALVPGVARTASSIAMRTHLNGRMLPLVEHAARG